jgi:hypothetical protein
MGKLSDDDTRVVLRKLAFCLPLFYVLYFAVAAAAMACFGLWDSSLLGSPAKQWARLPFDISQAHDFSFSNKLHAAAWLALVFTYVLGLSIMYWVVRSTRKSWDYATTISFAHLIVCIAVTQAFPDSWVWWVTLVVATAFLGGAGELTNYKCRDLRDIELDH